MARKKTASDNVSSPPVEKPEEASPAQATANQNASTEGTQEDRSIDLSVIKDAKVKLIDNGNRGGLGIKLEFKDDKERPSEAVKQILKGDQEGGPGLRWHREMAQWRQRVDLNDPISSRENVQRRFAEVVKQMKQEKDSGPAR
jgi:hypothetical protein